MVTQSTFVRMGLKTEKTYHQKRRPGRDDGAVPRHVLDTHARQGHRDNRPEAQNLFAERLDVHAFFVFEAFLPCAAVGVDGVYFCEHFGLESGALGAREGGYAEEEAGGCCVQPAGYHGYADGFDFRC